MQDIFRDFGWGPALGNGVFTTTVHKRFKDNMTNEPMVLGTDTELLTDAHMDSFPFWIGISQIFKAMEYDLD